MIVLGRFPDCGATVSNDVEGCEALWHELFYAHPMTHPAAFDAYCMQHLEKYCASAKSYAAHLARLCCGLEYEANPRIYAAIQTWLNGNRRIEKPAPLSFLGALTIGDVYEARTRTGYEQVVKNWIEGVWAAYEPQHQLAHAWIEEALATGASERRSSK